MTELYLINVEQLNDDEIFAFYMSKMSLYRIKKIERVKRQQDKARALGVGILIDEFLKKNGFSEKEMVYKLNENGKPYFQNKCPFYFNASHSGSYAVCAFSDDEVGCDIERISERNVNVAKRFFAEMESSYILKSNNVQKSFTRIWTIKESYLKYLGCGLTKQLNSFEVVGLEKDKIIIIDNGNKINCCLKEYDIDDMHICVCAKNDKFVMNKPLKIEGNNEKNIYF